MKYNVFMNTKPIPTYSYLPPQPTFCQHMFDGVKHFVKEKNNIMARSYLFFLLFIYPRVRCR